MADPAATPLDLTGSTLGDFHILRKLGQGGMGQVYLARQLSLKREVALKLLRRELSANPTALARFQSEAEAVARVTHANIVQVYAIGEFDGHRYMALEYVDGRNLKDFLLRKGVPDLPVAMAVIRQVAAALQRASELGIVHRDIKPENIMLTRKVEVKVADFGLSRFFADAVPGRATNLTQSGVTLGTPLYMSPEQVRGGAVDHRSDIYSFGVTCYHMLAGEPPFQGKTAFDVAMKHISDVPKPLAEHRPDLPPDLCAMVQRMMEKDPDARYQTARDINRDLSKLQRALAANGGTTVGGSGVALGGSGTGLDRLGSGAGLTASGSAAVLVGSASASTSTAGQATTGPSAATLAMPLPTPGSRWMARSVGSALVAGLGIVGWVAYAQTHADDPGSGATAGLPDVRPASRTPNAREKELTAVWENKAAKPMETIDAGLALGLLHLHDVRLDDAEKVFGEMETRLPERKLDWTADAVKRIAEQFRPNGAAEGNEFFRRFVDNWKRTIADRVADVPGRLGQAVVLAERNEPTKSNTVFGQALQSLDSLGPGFLKDMPKGTKARRLPGPDSILGEFLKAHPDFAKAIAAALQRNADNLKQKVPEKFEWLTTPTNLARGPK